MNHSRYLIYFGELYPRVGGHPVGRDLPQQDPEGPNVRLGRKPKKNVLKFFLNVVFVTEGVREKMKKKGKGEKEKNDLKTHL